VYLDLGGFLVRSKVARHFREVITLCHVFEGIAGPRIADELGCLDKVLFYFVTSSLTVN
jgi:hypothetical protein